MEDTSNESDDNDEILRNDSDWHNTYIHTEDQVPQIQEV